MDTGRSVMCLEMWISSFKDNKTACSFMQMGSVEWRKHSYVLVGATTAWISTLWCQLLTAAALNNNLCVPANLHNLLLEKIVTLLLSGRQFFDRVCCWPTLQEAIVIGVWHNLMLWINRCDFITMFLWVIWEFFIFALEEQWNTKQSITKNSEKGSILQDLRHSSFVLCLKKRKEKKIRDPTLMIMWFASDRDCVLTRFFNL